MSTSPFLQQVREAIRTRQYSYRTEQSDVRWIRGFILFHRCRHPSETGETEVAQYLTSLATQRKISAPTQSPALNALVFLFRQALHRPPGELSQDP